MVPDEIKNLTEGVVSSYDAGIAAVGHLIEKGLDLLDGYRSEQEAIRGSLRESLATVGSLRRKDFDEVMEQILEFQSRRETEIKGLIRSFLSRQRDLTGMLRRSIGAGILKEVERVKEELSQMIEKAREAILSFQGEQEKIRKTFESLEARKGEIAGRELKRVIGDLEMELMGKTAVSDQRSAVS